MNITIIRANALGTPRVAKTAKVLTEAGHSVKIVRWERQIRDDTNKYTDYLSNVEIISIKTAKARSNAFYRSLIGRMGYLIKVFFFVLLHRKETDIFHCVDFDSAYPVYIASLFNKRIQYNYDIADYLQDYDTKAPQFLIRLLSRIDGKLRKRAKAIFVPHQNRLKRIEAAYRHKTYIVNNAPYISAKKEQSSFFHIDIDKNKISIIYYGVLSRDRGIELFIKVANKLHKEYRFFVAGTGSMKDAVTDNGNIAYLGELKYNDCMAVLNKMDISFVFYNPDVNVNRHASPNKFFEAVMFGIPLLVAKGTTIDANVQADNLGYVAEYNEESLLTLLKGLSKNEIEEMKIKCSSDKGKYSFERSRSELLTVYGS